MRPRGGAGEQMVDGIAQTVLQFTLAGGAERAKEARALIQTYPPAFFLGDDFWLIFSGQKGTIWVRREG